ncbi:MAG: ABC transporter substrate-binding protein [Peptococcaceae bacterium]|jgi:peptide/nickel transport system substrate-binding protein|nr:ABC transporter substrate-binding protein [Peptococcaceae bacterium]
MKMKRQRQRQSRGILTLILALALLAGCGGQPAVPGGQASGGGGGTSTAGAASVTSEPDTLIVAVDSEGDTFDPFDYADLDDGFLVRQVHEPLAYLDSTSPNGFSPVLAESWEYPNDQTILLHLRQGVMFQNGEEMKAGDVLFSLRTTKERGLLNPNNWTNLDLDNATVIDDYTLEISTFEPSSFSFSWLLSEMVSIVSEKAYAELGAGYARNPNGGTGPYILTDWVAGDRVTFTRNENYWGTMPQYKTLVLRFIIDGTARTFAVESGGVDVAYSCPTADLGTLSSLDGYEVIRQVTSGVNYLWFNNNDEHLKDIRVRQALSYALDLQTMVPIAYNNMGAVADSVFGPSCPQKIVPDTIYRQDMDKAKQLLADAGYGDGFDLKIIITDRASRKTLAEMMKNIWANLNINLEIEVLELSTILELVFNDDYQLTIMAEGGFHGEAWRSYMHTEGVNNYSKYSNARVDELFNLAVETSDAAEGMVYYTEMQQIFADEVPILPMQYDEILNVVRKGFYYSVDPTYNFMAARFYYIRYDE